MFIHISHNSNLKSIKEKGLRAGKDLGDLRLKTAPDKDKVSVFYLEDNTENDTLTELRRILYEGKIENPSFSHYREEDLVIIVVDCSDIEWTIEKKPAEMFYHVGELSDILYKQFKGYAKTYQSIPSDCLKVLDF